MKYKNKLDKFKSEPIQVSTGKQTKVVHTYAIKFISQTSSTSIVSGYVSASWNVDNEKLGFKCGFTSKSSWLGLVPHLLWHQKGETSKAPWTSSLATLCSTNLLAKEICMEQSVSVYLYCLSGSFLAFHNCPLLGWFLGPVISKSFQCQFCSDFAKTFI